MAILDVWQDNEAMRKIIESVVDAMLVLAVIGLLPLAWLMRDGLGPDAVASSGLKAISRCFMTFYSGPILVAVVALAVFLRCRSKTEQDPAAEPTPATNAEGDWVSPSRRNHAWRDFPERV